MVQKQSNDSLSSRLINGEHYSFIWNNFESVPSKEFLKSDKYFCIDHQSVAEDELIEWLKRCEEEAIEQRVVYLKIAVFANFRELNSGEVVRLTKVLGDHGATLSDYPEHTGNFADAVASFSVRAEKVVNNAREYAERRRILLSEKTIQTREST